MCAVALTARICSGPPNPSAATVLPRNLERTLLIRYHRTGDLAAREACEAMPSTRAGRTRRYSRTSPSTTCSRWRASG